MTDDVELITAAAPFERTYCLDTIERARTGDGRTVEAYCAVFDVAAEVRDRDGWYDEELDSRSFTKTLAEQGDRFIVMFNHAKTIYGTPSEAFATPLGKPLEVRADAKGVFTRTRYNRTPLADQVLDMIDNGDVTGQSFSGKFIRSQRMRGRGRDGRDLIRRTEVAMREYGPGIVPVYKEAAILGVRAEDLLDTLRGLTAEQRAELLDLISRTSPEPAGDAAPAAADAALPGTSERHETARTRVLAAMSARGLR